MLNLYRWFQDLKLPHIHMYLDFALDEFVINSSVTNRSKKISRYALEDAIDPHFTILEAISDVMAVPLDKLREILNPKANPLPNPSISHSDGIYDYAADGTVIGTTQWVSDSTVVITTGAGGSGGSGIGGVGGYGQVAIGGGGGSSLPTLGQWMANPNGSITRQGYVTTVDELYSVDYKSEQYARNALFTEAEQYEIRAMKSVLKNNYLKFMPRELGYNEKVVVAGGCFASFLNNELPHDIDVFILDDAKTKQYVRYYVDDVSRDSPGRFKIGNSNYMDNDKIEYTAFDMNNKLQFVTTSYITRAKLIAHFDMVHCCVSYTPYNDKLYITREIFDVIKNTQIRSNQSGRMELIAPWRVEKMTRRGWRIH